MLCAAVSAPATNRGALAVSRQGRETDTTRRRFRAASSREQACRSSAVGFFAQHAPQSDMRYIALVLIFAASLPAADDGWPTYGGDAGGTRYSPLRQVTRANVAKLKVAWTYHTGALQPETRLNDKAAFEATPILVNGTLYLSTPYNQVIALDPATGAEKWKFDPQIPRTHGYSEVASRGVAAWTDAKGAKDAPCHLRIFEGTIDARLLAIDGRTGKLCADFGDGGQVDLTQGVDFQKIFRGNYEVTSAPTVAGDVVITGSSIGDNVAVNLERGVVRGYDTRTGKLLWTWDPIPWASQQKVRTGAANAWSTIAADEQRGSGVRSHRQRQSRLLWRRTGG